MSWPCRLIDCTNELTGQTLKIGDMFFWDEKKFPLVLKTHVLEEGEDPYEDDDFYWFRGMYEAHKVSDYYLQHNSHRPPLFVWLPGKTLFPVDGKCWNQGGYYGGWQVTGDAPNITITPSINVGGSYHGFLTNGVISDDCEGRVFDEQGRRLPL